MYTKLHAQILDSTIWQEAKETKILWITMLAMCDQHGEVMASIPGLAKRAGLTLEECEKSLEVLLSPDKYSRTADEQGRRITEIDGGWEVINHLKYREMGKDEQARNNNAARQRRWRERQKRNGRNVISNGSSRHTETETETEEEDLTVQSYQVTRMAPPDSDLNDHLEISSHVEAAERLRWIHGKLGEPTEASTKRMLSQAATASVSQFSEHWLVDSVNAVLETAPRQKWAYLRRCLQNKAKEAGGKFV